MAERRRSRAGLDLLRSLRRGGVAFVERLRARRRVRASLRRLLPQRVAPRQKSAMLRAVSRLISGQATGKISVP